MVEHQFDAISYPGISSQAYLGIRGWVSDPASQKMTTMTTTTTTNHSCCCHDLSHIVQFEVGGG